MNHYHDPIKHVKFLRQSLSQDKKPMGIFVSAGCPLAVQMPDSKWPLIPDVARLTKFVHSELKAKEGEERNTYDSLLDELQKTGKDIDNPNFFYRRFHRIKNGILLTPFLTLKRKKPVTS